MKILLTGAAGFIGYHTVLSLVRSGKEVIGLDNINNYYDPILKLKRLEKIGIDSSLIINNVQVKSKRYKNFSFVKLNIEDKLSIDNLFAENRFDIVIHLAAQAGVRYSMENPDVYIQSNLIGFYNIINASATKRIKHFVYASSSSVYGSNEKIPFSEADPADHPLNLYAATKRSNELIAHSYSHTYDLPTTGLRFFTVYGPWGRPDMALFKFTKSILENQPIEVYNKGDMVRDFTYVDDIVRGILEIIKNPPHRRIDVELNSSGPSSSTAPYAIYNIGNNHPVNLLSFISAIESATNRKAIIHHSPLHPGDVKNTHADINCLKSYIGYTSSTDYITGISRFVKWYKEYYKK